MKQLDSLYLLFDSIFLLAIAVHGLDRSGSQAMIASDQRKILICVKDLVWWGFPVIARTETPVQRSVQVLHLALN